MAETTYSFATADDMPSGKVNPPLLQGEIGASSISAAVNRIDTIGGSCANGIVTGGVLNVVFSDALSAGDETTLHGDTANPAGGLLGAHSPIETPVGGYWDGVVGSTAPGQFSSVGAALAAGCQTIFIKNGVYIETTDLDLPNNAVLYGESPGGVVLVMVAGNSVKADGSGGTMHTGGTIAATNGDATVTGTGTSFTDLEVEDWICIDAVWHHIDEITDDTHLELKSPYRGRNLSGWPLRSQPMIAGLLIQNIMVYNSSSVGVYFRAVNHGVIRDSMISGSGSYGVHLEDCTETFLISTVVQRGATHGVRVNNCSVIILNVVAPKENNGDGIVINDSRNVILDACDICMNDGNGLNVTGASSLVNVTDGIVNRNNEKGVNTDNGTGSCLIDACTITNNRTDGVDFDGAENVISDCVIENNGSHGVQAGHRGVINGNHIGNNGGNGINLDSDKNCCVSNNVIEENSGIGIRVPDNTGEHTINGNQVRANDGDGINVAGDLCAITGNTVLDNGGTGVLLTASSTTNAVGVNVVKRNTTAQINDLGTGNVLTGNAA